MEFCNGLRLQSVPTEFVYYPDGDHRLVKPREIFRSQQGNVDWFRFWLKGEEGDDPVQPEQYARWRNMRTKFISERSKLRNGLATSGLPVR
jgi:hypothetical protein